MEVDNKSIYKTFIEFVAKELQLSRIPTVSINNTKTFYDDSKSMGYYNPELNSLEVCEKDRHILDVLRTLAHELTHHSQKLKHKTLDGSTGSVIENEANAIAGMLVRKFVKKYTKP